MALVFSEMYLVVCEDRPAAGQKLITLCERIVVVLLTEKKHGVYLAQSVVVSFLCI